METRTFKTMQMFKETWVFEGISNIHHLNDDRSEVTTGLTTGAATTNHDRIGNLKSIIKSFSELHFTSKESVQNL